MPTTLRRRLALPMIVGLLLSAAPNAAAAQAQKIALSGGQRLFFGESARVWSADGWTRFRGDPLSGTFAFNGAGVSLAGTITYLDHAKLDAAGNGIVEGTISYTDARTGVTCQGVHQGKVTNLVGELRVVAPCADGRLLTGDEQDTDALFDSEGNFIGVGGEFTGVLLTPGG